ncbi:MAG: DUF296 domain-containing protein [Candidatus Omnitrophica bacterium]|jgi:hypothetical protein|nr:DUF296 domain-containing protein [Candidatus Omnitrophota bacterium]MDD3275239.1 DUF296 domain-containing protein [Candidatus Omnitrophota bacterium]MDD5077856.1 DUF296 domain-containing protein [Candidatus Omnitrophota bacterium]
MKYTKGEIGRVFLVKFDNNDILIPRISDLARKEKIRSASIIFIGALRAGELAAGPRKPVIPPDANMLSFKDGWEVMGLGTIFTNTKGPQIHIHASMGKKNKVLTGCVRGDSRVFLVVEAVILELKGVKANKEIDPRTGLNLLKII